jgi:hypothetical protein
MMFRCLDSISSADKIRLSMYIKKACLLIFLLIVSLVVGYWIVLSRHIDFPPSLIIAGVSGFFMAIAIGAIAGIRNYIEEIRVIRESGRMPAFKDGKRIAVSGFIYPVNGHPVKSPFTRRDSVAYEYHVKEFTGKSGNDSERLKFFGYCLTPSVIKTSFGDIKLLAWPDMRNFEEKIIESGQRSLAADYIISTPFRAASDSPDVSTSAKFSQAMKELSEIFNDDDGSIRIDNTADQDHSVPTGEKLNGAEIIVRVDPQHRLHFETAARLRFSEKYVPSGEAVCLIGTWSSAKGGVVSEVMNKGKMATIFRGNGEATISELKSKIVKSLVFGVITIILINTVVWFIVTKF